mmetsp:Transcript_2609/g.10072  ORF Transcript_2609/g.10072 Transcript_2609/m.10072 type:complete len:231 (+) Transcript_2609:1069-1761(+)
MHRDNITQGQARELLGLLRPPVGGAAHPVEGAGAKVDPEDEAQQDTDHFHGEDACFRVEVEQQLTESLLELCNPQQLHVSRQSKVPEETHPFRICFRCRFQQGRQPLVHDERHVHNEPCLQILFRNLDRPHLEAILFVVAQAEQLAHVNCPVHAVGKIDPEEPIEAVDRHAQEEHVQEDENQTEANPHRPLHGIWVHHVPHHLIVPNGPMVRLFFRTVSPVQQRGALPSP